jgi:hypothetical protein
MSARAIARFGRALPFAAAACGGPTSATGPSDASPPLDGSGASIVQVDTGCGATQTDPRNCGGCGIDCGGGACVEGVCSSPPLGVLASGQQTPVGIALDDANVYWMNLGISGSAAQVMKCAKTGCGNAPTVLASAVWSAPTRLAVYGGTVYWATDGLLLSCSTDGCPGGPTVLSSGALRPTDIAVGAAGIYVGDLNQGALLVYPLAGGANPTAVWSSFAAPAAIALGRTTVYFATTGVSLLSCGAAGCATIVSGGMPTALALDGTYVYIGTQALMSPGTVGWCPEAPDAGCAAGPKLLTSRVTYCAGIAGDGTNVYFSDRGMARSDGGSVFSGLGRVAKCPLAGCAGNPTPVAGFVNLPQQIAVDGTTVYWTDFGSSTDPSGTMGGRVMTAAK